MSHEEVTQEEEEGIKLTQYSHGAGCGCKLSPAVLDSILATPNPLAPDPRLLVGNDKRDDAAALDLGDGRVLLSTTDFFMPIVDDPYEFGRIASANAISDVYAMGGTPAVAIAILGWPIDKLPPEVAGQVIEGARSICQEAGITLAGGHSIDSPEPIFGLSVNGLVDRVNLKQNDGAQAGDLLFLTKPLGVGVLATAEKRGLLREEDIGCAARSMMRLNSIGQHLAKIEGVHAMTDVTGFGLLGHLGEMCVGSEVRARIDMESLVWLTDLDFYIEQGAIPGGSRRNWESYGHNVAEISEKQRTLLCDPQTSGGLLVAAAPEAKQQVADLLLEHDLWAHMDPIGVVLPQATQDETEEGEEEKPAHLIEVRGS
jgi:selenide,water dikinase